MTSPYYGMKILVAAASDRANTVFVCGFAVVVYMLCWLTSQDLPKGADYGYTFSKMNQPLLKKSRDRTDQL